MMNIRDRLGSAFAFNAIPTTVLLVLIYAAIFSTVLVTDNLPAVPKDTRGLDLDRAWSDLHLVSARPHPFNSHANDLIRDFLLQRLGGVVSQYPHIVVDYDVVSNASWATSRAVYQEGNNILVKVQGTDPAFRESGGYLLSAHYDSVSTAPGTTDDSIGIVTLLQMVEYFAKHRPKRTVVFNFNNNEESGLNGAHAFLEHPWANIPDVFLNLEGAAAGGRPVMFRATNIAPLFSWTSSRVPHPHANVITADSFARGLIRSATDYSVYEQAGLNGLDFAFYRGRSRYHTWYDSIPGMEGGKKALWAMMEATHGASLALANDDAVHAQSFPRQDKPVYFELFGAALIVFSLEALFIVNVILLSAGPILLLLLAYSKHVACLSSRTRYSPRCHENDVQGNTTYGERALAALVWFGNGCWISTKFWVALGISIGLQAALITGYVKLNPFILHSRPFVVFASAFSLAYLSIVLVLSFPCSLRGGMHAPELQKLSILLQLYTFTWALLVFSTVVLRSADIGSTYFITAWNVCTLLACVIGLLEAMTNTPDFESQTDAGSDRYVGGAGYQAITTEEDGNGQQLSHRIIEDSEPTETTPLVSREHLRAPFHSPDEGKGAIGWWILQLLLVVPFPVVLVFHIAIIILGASNQTLTDGNNPTFTYATVSLLALLLILPMSPFSINAHRWLTILVLVIFILSTVYTWVAFPFSQQTPLKVYFVQSVNLNSTGTGIEHATTALTGPKQFLTRHIIPELPSSLGQSVVCDNETYRAGLQTCTWQVGGEMVPSPGGNSTLRDGTNAPWVSYRAERTGSNSARITVQGLNTRFCTLHFTNRRISRFSVVGDGHKGLQKDYGIPSRGLSEIQLWSREFGKEFEVSVEWKEGNARGADADSDDGLQGRVSCGWDEYERATVGGGRSGGRIPSLEEVMAFLPEWAVVSKSTSALFSASRSFEV